MAITRQCLLVTLFLTTTLFTGAIRGAEPIDSEKPVTDKPITSSTTVQPPAPAPETTKAPAPVTTKAPEPPTTKPSSTTVSPTTPPTTPPSTPPTTAPTTPPTTAPTTVVPPPTTPAPAPTTTPAPSKAAVGNWTVGDGNRTVAIFRAAITIDLAFVDKSNKTQHYDVYVPTDAKVDAAKVVENENSFSLVFPAGYVHMMFMQNNSHYFLQKVDSFIDVTVLPELANQTTATNFTVSYVAAKESASLEASLNSSYVCAAPTALPMTNGTMLQLASVTYQAFISDGKLGPAENCVTDNSPDMVPILVAGGLILFVVLILVAYIVTRQRQARGYHSM